MNACSRGGRKENLRKGRRGLNYRGKALRTLPGHLFDKVLLATVHKICPNAEKPFAISAQFLRELCVNR
jgi:hypothetical protein